MFTFRMFMGSVLVELEINILAHLYSFNASALEGHLTVALNAALGDSKTGDYCVDAGSATVQRPDIDTVCV